MAHPDHNQGQTLRDEDLLLAARAGADGFGHREHLRLAWLAVRGEGAEAGAERVARILRHVAASHGEPKRYHETITRFWIRLVAHAVEVERGLDDFDAFLERFPLLLDGSLLGRHWSGEALTDGRPAWVEPDLLPLP